MCDTFIAMPDVTCDGSVIFGKNSDREPNEAQQVVLLPAMDHPEGSQLKCTYIEIPQVRHTHAVLLSKPFWMWGAEMGANDKGVVIGNEAVFTKLPPRKEPALLGMDLLRLGLERGSSAEEALHVIIQLLETHGQGGNCGLTHPLFYENSFLIADASHAWVLETAGRHWAAEKVTRGVRSISNAITIGTRWDLASSRLVSTAVEKGWSKKVDDFDFGRDYSDFVFTTFSDAHSRQACTTSLLQKAGCVDLPYAFSVLRSHGGSEKPDWSPDRAVAGASVCCHVGFGPIRISQTTGSLVSRLRQGEEPVHWVTGTAAPCTGIFKPVWFSTGLPETGPAPTARADADSLWWQHERLHRLALMNYQNTMALYRQERDEMESRFLQRAANGPLEELSRVCFSEASEAGQRWYKQARRANLRTTARFYYRQAWARFNRDAGLSFD